MNRAIALLVAVCAGCLLLAAGCTYESIRMHERSRCGAMPQSQSQQCYSRTQDTQAEYNAKRRKLKESGNSDKAAPDPRYEQWIP
jgi:hypothetical protein